MVALSALALTACGGARKMTASQTALWIQQHAGTDGTEARCEKGTYWDYACTMRWRLVAPDTVWVDVDDHKVTRSSFELPGV